MKDLLNVSLDHKATSAITRRNFFTKSTVGLAAIGCLSTVDSLLGQERNPAPLSISPCDRPTVIGAPQDILSGGCGGETQRDQQFWGVSMPTYTATALAAYEWRLKNSYEAAQATAAYRIGDYTTVFEYMRNNPTLAFEWLPPYTSSTGTVQSQIMNMLQVTGLINYIDVNRMVWDSSRGGYFITITNVQAAESYLTQATFFRNGYLGGLHSGDVGGWPRLDARSITGQSGGLGDRSLQFVIGPLDLITPPDCYSQTILDMKRNQSPQKKERTVALVKNAHEEFMDA